MQLVPKPCHTAIPASTGNSTNNEHTSLGGFVLLNQAILPGKHYNLRPV
ncbi:hypothetical protein [Pontibacter sp. BT731]|nr:hypothetical protein [Pontibacter sp. BT731]